MTVVEAVAAGVVGAAAMAVATATGMGMATTTGMATDTAMVTVGAPDQDLPPIFFLQKILAG